MARHVGARVYNSGAITITTATATPLTFDSERYDYDTMHSTVTNTGRLTFTTAGIYMVTGHIAFASNTTGVRNIQIRLDGSTVIADIVVNAATGGNKTRMSIATVYEVTAAQYAELVVTQTSGGDLTVDVDANRSPEFAAHRVG